MNEIFSFRRELNIKKIIIVVLIILIIISIILWKFFISANNSEAKKITSADSNNQTTTFYSENKKITLTFPNSYDFIQYKPKNNYLLELRNENNLNIFITKETLLDDTLLSEIVNADLKSYVAQFNNSSNVSNISEFDRGGTPAYTYSLHYLDSKTNTAYYLQTIWIENNNDYYILDIEFPLNSLNENSKIINDILNSIIIN